MWYLNFAATLILIVHLVVTRLYRRYSFLFLYLSADAAQTALGLLFQHNKNAYAWIYVIGQPLKIVLAVCVVLELCCVALAQRPALALYARSTAGYVLAAAALLALSFIALDVFNPARRPPVLNALNSFERSMDICLLFFLLAITAFMFWFPVRITRNGALYIGGFALYFLSRAIGLLLTNLQPARLPSFDLAMLSVSCACLVGWLAALRSKGEDLTVVASPRRDPAAILRLTRQLDDANARLAALSRR